MIYTYFHVQNFVGPFYPDMSGFRLSLNSCSCQFFRSDFSASGTESSKTVRYIDNFLFDTKTNQKNTKPINTDQAF